MIWGLYAVYKVANKTIGIDETQAQQLRSIYSSYKAYFDMLARVPPLVVLPLLTPFLRIQL
jgi:hypothetical protein